MAVNEEIVTGKKFRRLIDIATNKWRRYSFWNKAKDTECEDGTDVETKVGAIKGITTSTNVSETGYAADAKTVSEINQSLTNVNNLKRTYLRLVLPNVAAEAKAVCDYINKNYLLGQLSPVHTVEFDVVAANADWFSGVLSTDSNILVAGRTVWGFVQQRTTSAENSTLYKYFASGTGGAGTVSPFKRFEDGYNTGYAAGQSAGVPSGSCIAGWRSIDSYSNGQWVTGWVGVNPNFFTVNSAGIIPVKNFTATVYWQGCNKRDIDFFSNGAMGHRDNGTSLDGVRMNFYAGTQCGFKTNDSGGGSLGAGFIVLN